jgi:hypothetical protein
LVSLEERWIHDFRQRIEQSLSGETVRRVVDDLRASVHGGFRDPLNFEQSHIDPIAGQSRPLKASDGSEESCVRHEIASSQSRTPSADIAAKAVFLPVESN